LPSSTIDQTPLRTSTESTLVPQSTPVSGLALDKPKQTARRLITSETHLATSQASSHTSPIITQNLQASTSTITVNSTITDSVLSSPATPFTDNIDQVPEQVLVGSSSRGVYVPKMKLEGLTTKIPSNYTLKLFELVFSRDEAFAGSVEGKGERLIKLDANRIMAIYEQTDRHFKTSENKCNWETTKKVIDSKCRMVRNNRCKTWAGKSFA